MRDRVIRLRDRLFRLDDRTVFWERVLALRRAHQRHAGERRTLLYALTMRETTTAMSVVIGDDDLIVGEPHEVLLAPEEEARYTEYARDYLQPPWFHTRGHLTPAWELVLERGLLDLGREAEERTASLNSADPDAARRREFWEAASICCQVSLGSTQSTQQ